MNSHQRRKAVRAISRGEVFRDYDRHKWVHFLGLLKYAYRQVGTYSNLIKKAANAA